VDERPVPFGNKAFQTLSCPPGQDHGRLAGSLVHYPQVTPEDAPVEAGAKRFGAGFLCGIALGVGSRPLGAAVGLLALDLGEDAPGESFAIALELASIPAVKPGSRGLK
jgi:hypothetical protein